MLKQIRSFIKWAFSGTLCILLFPDAGFAEIGADVSAWIILDQNAFQNYEEISDRIIQPSMTLTWSHNWSSSGLKLFYEGLYSDFQSFDRRRYQTHYGGFSYQQFIGAKGPVCSAGLQIGQRTNMDSLYNYYNYMHKIVFLNLRQQWSSKGMSVFGFWAQERAYAEWQAFDFREMRVFVQQNIFLPSRTTLIGRIQFGNKRFLESMVSESEVEDLIPRLDDPVGASGGDPGSGSGGSGSGSGGGRGNGKNSGQGYSNSSLSKTASSEDSLSTVRVEIPGHEIFQWKYSLRIAQSVFAQTGLAVEGKWQRQAEGAGRLLSYQDSGYEENDPLFDDPYNYDSDALSLELTQKLPWGMTLKTGADWEDKEYQYRAFDPAGQVLPDSSLRQDSSRMLWISFTKRFSAGWIKRAEVSVSYHDLINQSNEPYSDYTDRVVIFGWSFGI